LKESKANIDGNWNNRGDKFIVGAASGNVFVAVFSQANNFWIGHSISGKRPLHSSSVLNVRFDPLTSRVCASVSTDGKCYITSAFVKELDNETAGPFGSVTSFGEKLVSFNMNGWINFVSFSPSSEILCYGSHDCEINFIDISKAASKSKEKPDKVFYKGNPFLTSIFITDGSLIACGYDKVPYLFKKAAKGWEFVKVLDEGFGQVRESKIAMGSFEQSKAKFAQGELQKSNTVKLDDDIVMKEMNTKHENFINCMKIYA